MSHRWFAPPLRSAAPATWPRRARREGDDVAVSWRGYQGFSNICSTVRLDQRDEISGVFGSGKDQSRQQLSLRWTARLSSVVHSVAQFEQALLERLRHALTQRLCFCLDKSIRGLHFLRPPRELALNKVLV